MVKRDWQFPIFSLELEGTEWTSFSPLWRLKIDLKQLSFTKLRHEEEKISKSLGKLGETDTQKPGTMDTDRDIQWTSKAPRGRLWGKILRK